MMVERQLLKEGKKRREMGREKFIERVWEWRREYGGAILDQMKRLGASVDWGREYFTMDDHLSHAVKEVFVRLYDDGLIYRGKYIVNWCSDCGTAISDLEVKHEDVAGKLYEIRYPVVGDVAGKAEFITVATTRPETMLGDTAIAVNPKDERYLHLHGKHVMLPLMNREIPIIADELAQPEFGTGAVKVTPAHDPNDFEAGLRHNLPQIEVIDEHAKMNANAGRVCGLDRFAARARVVEDLAEQGFLVGTKDYTIALGKCDRSGTIVEPRLSTQWFIKIAPLAKRAIEVVEKGYIQFTPENYGQIYLNWMNNIHDWCISRQLWWGHRIPAWYCTNQDCKEVVVAREAPAACAKCGGKLEQDTDVLDTWFSSGLLPFTTLGWPEATRDLEAFYPNSLMITGFDILFFWVARMIMLGCWFMMPPHKPGAKSGGAGFRRRCAAGECSLPRSLYSRAGARCGPAEDVEDEGERARSDRSDRAVRDGRDAVYAGGDGGSGDGHCVQRKPDGGISEFRQQDLECGAVDVHECGPDRSEPAACTPEGGGHYVGVAGFQAVTLEDRWILSRFNRAAADVNASLQNYRFDEAATRIYDFFWAEFCDWYLELIKPRLNFEEGADTTVARVACANLVNLFEASLRLLHPVMPFITEEIWHAMYDGKPPLKSIALAAYPAADEKQIDLAVETEMAILQDLIVSVRNLRAELKVEPKVKVPIEVFAHEPAIRAMLEKNLSAVLLDRPASVEKITFVDSSLANLPGARSTSRFDVHAIYEKKIDVAAERERLTKELEKIEKQLASSQTRLGDEQFLSKAPAKVVDGLRKQVEESTVLREKTAGAVEGTRRIVSRQ